MKSKLFFTLLILCFLLWSPAPTHAQNAGFIYANNTIGNDATGTHGIAGPFALRTSRSAPPPPLGIAPGIRAALIDTTHCVPNTSPQSVWFVSPIGAGSMNGSNPANAMTLTAAAQAAQIPSSGSAYVCLLGGRYELSSELHPAHGGAPRRGSGDNQYIVYQSYGDGDVDIVWTGGAGVMIRIDSTSSGIGHPTPYLKFIGLNLDGMNAAIDGFFCRQNDGMWFLGNMVSNTGGAGIGTQRCGYVFSDHNLINHNGYNPSASNTSGISYNQNECTDNWDGLHFVISNNIIVGEIDKSAAQSDGNGIILDIQDNNLGIEGACTAPGFTPPTALIMNNIVYGNGGTCISAFDFQSYWVINNTCYTNDLNKAQASGNGGSIVSNSDGRVPTTNGYFVNNISYSWLTTNPPYLQEGSSSNIYYYNNLWWGPSGITCCSVPNWNNGFSGDPQFVNAPFFDPSIDGQYDGARPPSAIIPTYIETSFRCAGPWVSICDITGAFALASSSSPAYNNGIDPTTNSFLSSQMTSDLMSGLRNFAGSFLPYPISIYYDINGKRRTVGTNWDLGALAH